MNISQIEHNVKTALEQTSPDDFIYDFLQAYGLPKASITRLRKGTLDLSKKDTEVSLKKKVLFKKLFNTDLHVGILKLREEAKQKQRFIVVTDFETVLAIDTETESKLDTPYSELYKHFDFFLPWAGMEKAQYQSENPVDVKAAERMARLYDEIIKDNENPHEGFTHHLNIFLSRLLFCFFAEDTGIFELGVFSNSIGSHTQTDGSDLNSYIEKLFLVLDTPEDQRDDFPTYMKAFPYVNGGLFKEHTPIPKLSAKSRKAILESGTLDWAQIHPDIFGSMIQAVVTPEHRGGLGMHYTSVPNIMKVIQPLFLDDLYEEFEQAKGNPKKLDKLLLRLWNIKVFDPACGSGNFLIIAYKELRKLEIKVLKETSKLYFSNIQLKNFYGIELDDFAHEVAKLSLWLAEHQMNVVFREEFGRTNPTLPLKEAGKIVQGNATKISWNDVCPCEEKDEVYIVGNPPYLGGKLQSEAQKIELSQLANKFTDKYKNLDYISCWFIKAKNYIDTYPSVKVAFVSTNSICQGEQVNLLWPYILHNDIEIFFANPSFKWSNNAKSNAGVIVSIIGLRKVINEDKHLYIQGRQISVQNINPYLKPGPTVFVSRNNTPISGLPPMVFGSMARDGGNLMLTSEEKNQLLSSNPDAKKFIKRIYGSKEFIRGEERYCIWVEDTVEQVKKASNIAFIQDRLKKVHDFRKQSKAESTRKYAEKPHRFVQISYENRQALIIPKVSSERRDYIPIGFIEPGIVISDLAFGLYTDGIYMLGVLSSKMHMLWVKLVAGRLKSDFRYSNSICYNTFPFSQITEKQRQEITARSIQILDEREKFPERTMAQLYDPDKMPEGLREAHMQNDLAVDKCYRSRPFNSDEERLEHLFKLYEEMTSVN